MIVNGWEILSTKLFNMLYENLVLSVKELRDKSPEEYKSHPKTKLLASIQRAIKTDVPENPDNPIFRLGKTLGSEYAHWRRVKNNMPPRYRMFFRFNSNDSYNIQNCKYIIFAWFNDQFTLRKKGAKSDVYNVFKSLLVKKVIPDNWNELFAEAIKENME